MQTFLTKTSFKKVVLLDYLLEKDNWCAMEELRNLLNVTEKSVLHYIEELEDLFKQYNGNILLKNEDNKRFFIKKEKDFPIYNIYLHFYKASYNYHLIDFMYKYPRSVLKDFAKEQFTSVSTVFRYAKLLIPYFRRYHITFHPFQLELNASEANIRSFFYYFYWNSTRESSDKWPFHIEQKEIEKYIVAFERIYDITLTIFQKRVFSFWLAINIERSSFRKVRVDNEYKSVISDDPHFNLLKKWSKQINLSFNSDELCFLYRIIYSFGVIDGNAIYENSHAYAHQRQNTCSYRAVENLEKVLQSMFRFSLDIKDPELIFNFIAFHERSYLFYSNPDLFFNRTYIEEMKEEEPRTYHIMEKLKKELQANADLDVSKKLENWAQLFLDYYYVLDYYDLFLTNVKPIKILIQDDLHHTHRLWLMNKINLYFGHSYVFAFYDYRTNISEVDLVISNYYINTGKTPLLLMKNIPTERNWRLFEKTIYQLKKEKS
ncbi:TPA: helix-turn-helix domain-containing protein [Enterococcus faecium]